MAMERLWGLYTLRDGRFTGRRGSFSPAPFSYRMDVSLVSGQIKLRIWCCSSSKWAIACGNLLLDTQLATVRMSLLSSIWLRYHSTELSSSKGIQAWNVQAGLTVGSSGDYVKSYRTWDKLTWVWGTDLSLATLSPPITEGMRRGHSGGIGVRMRVSLHGDSSGL